MSQQMYGGFKIERKVFCPTKNKLKIKKLPYHLECVEFTGKNIITYLDSQICLKVKAPSLRIDFIYKFRQSHHICNEQDEHFLCRLLFKTLLYWWHNGKGHKETSRFLTLCRAHLTWILVRPAVFFFGHFLMLFYKGNKEGHSVPMKSGRKHLWEKQQV